MQHRDLTAINRESRSASRPFVIYGAGGHAAVVLDLVETLGLPPTLIVADAVANAALTSFRVLPSSAEQWLALQEFDFVIAVGDNEHRAVLFQELLRRKGKPLTLVHPRAFVSPRAKLGFGTVVCANASVIAGAEIGVNCIVNTAATVDHDCRVGEHSHICPGVHLAGAVTVGARSMLGTGSVVIPGISLGDGVVVGAGAVVVNDFPSGTIAYGVPAKARERGIIGGIAH